jgi:hypothetical protein
VGDDHALIVVVAQGLAEIMAWRSVLKEQLVILQLFQGQLNLKFVAMDHKLI